MKVIKAPNSVTFKNHSIFLAGSIEMGKAVDWQTEITNALSDEDVTILNPRRDDWDSSWEQSIDNPDFKLQVSWEISCLRIAETIVMYFDPNTKSPISLLELGLHANSNKMIVYCPEGFWRKGNVDVVCWFHRIPQANSMEDLIKLVKERIK